MITLVFALGVMLFFSVLLNYSQKGDLWMERRESARQQERADNNACACSDAEKKSAVLRWENKLLTEKLRAAEETLTRLDEYHKSMIAKR